MADLLMIQPTDGDPSPLFFTVETVYDAPRDGQPPLDPALRRGGGSVGGFVPEVLEEDPGRVVRTRGAWVRCALRPVVVGRPSTRSTN